MRDLSQPWKPKRLSEIDFDIADDRVVSITKYKATKPKPQVIKLRSPSSRQFIPRPKPQVKTRSQPRKLTDKQRLEVIELLKTTNLSLEAIGLRFRVSNVTVSKIRRMEGIQRPAKPKRDIPEPKHNTLPDKLVLDIKQALEETDIPMIAIAKQFDTSASTVAGIASGKRYAHLTGGAIKRSDLAYEHPRTHNKQIQAMMVELLEQRILSYKAIAEAINNRLGSRLSKDSVYKFNRRRKEKLGIDNTPYRETKYQPQLSRDNVIEIIRLLQETNLPMGVIAKQFGVAINAICRIRKGQNWRSVTQSFLVNGEIKRRKA